MPTEYSRSQPSQIGHGYAGAFLCGSKRVYLKVLLILTTLPTFVLESRRGEGGKEETGEGLWTPLCRQVSAWTKIFRSRRNIVSNDSPHHLDWLHTPSKHNNTYHSFIGSRWTSVQQGHRFNKANLELPTFDQDKLFGLLHTLRRGYCNCRRRHTGVTL